MAAVNSPSTCRARLAGQILTSSHRCIHRGRSPGRHPTRFASTCAAFDTSALLSAAGIVALAGPMVVVVVAPAVRRADVIRQSRPSVLMSTYPTPPPRHRWTLHRLTKIPWIAEFAIR